jgi:YidC/Oxa1 family membrane protein insertase
LAELWNTLIQQPMTNMLVVMYSTFGDFGITIIIFTVLVRVVTLPLTLRQVRSSKAMSELQPKIKEMQKKLAKNKQKLSQETMKLYKEAGINPMGCLWPMLIQLPIWIALYRSIFGALATTPEELLNLSRLLYSWPMVHEAIPLKETFLWLNLAQPDGYYILPILVGGTMWIQQKMVSAPGVDPRQQQMNSMMLWMMPLMFAFFTLQFPSGLAIYWVISNVVGIAIQYFVTGWGNLLPRSPAVPPAKQTAVKARKG